MGGQHGVENSLKVLNVVVEGGNVVEKVLTEEGGVGAKLSHLMEVSDELFGLAGLDIKKLGQEFGEYDAEDKAKLVTAFKKKFDLSDDHAEALVEDGLDLGVEGAEFAGKLIAFAKRVAAGKVVHPVSPA